VEAIPLNRDHSTMVKFETAGDGDFTTIYKHLQGMVDKLAGNWKMDRKHDGW
jgi:hypothetical protein